MVKVGRGVRQTRPSHPISVDFLQRMRQQASSEVYCRIPAKTLSVNPLPRDTSRESASGGGGDRDDDGGRGGGAGGRAGAENS